ncbi:MAG TPA: 6-bladed beta-propeller [Nitrososphaeraceae archaeon]|nr:6-bladed beta-propeller [Nitrososphaeraceae archaeon]
MSRSIIIKSNNPIASKIRLTDARLVTFGIVGMIAVFGTFILEWGSEGKANGQLSKPESSIVDSMGDVYIADYGNNRIQKFTNDGEFIKAWGSKGTADGQFQGPAGLSTDANDNIYVTDKNNDRIQVFTNEGQFITKFGTTGAGDGQFNKPEGIGVDKDTGTVYVADTGNTMIQVFKPIS